ncbi:antibiotic biosynthesis monooxygenase [Thalassotalea aquiviva]|uniref:antibiotic biosynthesis monooxygenase family protein n=1 Tax=Thalassotalea aquiviva TaxID=3242415 RepID=UPI00352B2D50
MFIAIYEFEIKPGSELKFRQAWLSLTKLIYQQCGSLGSRLHYSDKSHVMVGYAQWPSEAQWAKDHNVSDRLFELARQQMGECLVQSKVVYQLEVSDDYLQTTPAALGEL